MNAEISRYKQYNFCEPWENIFIMINLNPASRYVRPGNGMYYFGTALRSLSSSTEPTGIAHTPLGSPVELDIQKISGDSLLAYWFDPRTGTAEKIESFTKTENRTFTPVSKGRRNDWVLIVEDEAAKLITPGK